MQSKAERIGEEIGRELVFHYNDMTRSNLEGAIDAEVRNRGLKDDEARLAEETAIEYIYDARVEPKSNLDVLTDLMTWGNPLKQAVIMEAIGKYVDAVAKAGREEFKRQCTEAGTVNFMNPDAWFNCCAEVKAALDKHLGGR